LVIRKKINNTVSKKNIFKNNNIVVTGGAGGIGSATCEIINNKWRRYNGIKIFKLIIEISN